METHTLFIFYKNMQFFYVPHSEVHMCGAAVYVFVCESSTLTFLPPLFDLIENDSV